jgi:hypothetical protein
MRGMLYEVNDRLLTNPELLAEQVLHHRDHHTRQP